MSVWGAYVCEYALACACRVTISEQETTSLQVLEQWKFSDLKDCSFSGYSCTLVNTYVQYMVNMCIAHWHKGKKGK